MKPRVVYLFDTLSDVRFVDGFNRLFDLTLLLPERLSKATTNPPSSDADETRLPGGRLRFILSASRWLIQHRDEYDVVLVLDNVTAALASNLARGFTRKPNILILGRPTIEYFRQKRRTGASGPRHWVALQALKLLVAFNERASWSNAPISRHVGSTTGGSRNTLVPYYGVDTDAFAPRWSKGEARRSLDLPTDVPIVFCRSRIAPEKDPQTFFEAVRILRSSGRELLVLYVGGEYEEFTRIGRPYDVPLVARGHVHPLDELPIYYVASDVAVQTSWAEGLGLSPLEALACGTPVVATAVGGLRETIQDGVTGRSVPVGDPAALAEAIAWCLDDRQGSSRLASAGREMVLRSYSSKVAFEAWDELVRRAAGR